MYLKKNMGMPTCINTYIKSGRGGVVISTIFEDKHWDAFAYINLGKSRGGY